MLSLIYVEILSGRLLQVRAFFCYDCPFHRANLEADPAVDTGRKIDPVPVGPLSIFPRPVMDTGHRAGIYAICNAFANLGHNRMGHGVFSLKSLWCELTLF
jgi:hypothetical protein